jgi:hypothetical protein
MLTTTTSQSFSLRAQGSNAPDASSPWSGRNQYFFEPFAQGSMMLIGLGSWFQFSCFTARLGMFVLSQGMSYQAPLHGMP